jgi:FkbM family methyltransferase
MARVLVTGCSKGVGFATALAFAVDGWDVTATMRHPAVHGGELRRNLAPYGARSVVIEAALWSSARELALTSGFRDARHWSRQVTPFDGSSDRFVPGMTIDDVLARCGVERISILKLDIEGAEAELFRDGDSPWMGAVDTFVVELHDDAGHGQATERFRAALARHDPVYATSGELTIASPRSRPVAAG